MEHERRAERLFYAIVSVSRAKKAAPKPWFNIHNGILKLYFEVFVSFLLLKFVTNNVISPGYN